MTTLKKSHRFAAFSLIEIMIAIAIIAILTAIALPSYMFYLHRARYTEIIQAAAPYKIAINECFQTEDSLSQCNAGENGIPIWQPGGKQTAIATITVQQGKITITPRDHAGITADDQYILTAVPEQHRLIWQTSGGGKARGYVH